jgi:hypothetical protein
LLEFVLEPRLHQVQHPPWETLMPYEQDELLVSIYIPKCAGTSLLKVLRTWFSPGFSEQYPNDQGIYDPFDASFVKRVHGHFFHLS